jgi:hypothetical protein
LSSGLASDNNSSGPPSRQSTLLTVSSGVEDVLLFNGYREPADRTFDLSGRTASFMSNQSTESAADQMMMHHHHHHHLHHHHHQEMTQGHHSPRLSDSLVASGEEMNGSISPSVNSVLTVDGGLAMRCVVKWVFSLTYSDLG